MVNQRKQTIDHIELYIKKVKTAEIESVRTNYTYKAMGILSLARMLDIISYEEYEAYFDELYI